MQLLFTVLPRYYFGRGTVPSTENLPKAAGDVFSSVLCGPNGHKDYLRLGRGNSSLSHTFCEGLHRGTGLGGVTYTSLKGHVVSPSVTESPRAPTMMSYGYEQKADACFIAV